MLFICQIHKNIKYLWAAQSGSNPFCFILYIKWIEKDHFEGAPNRCLGCVCERVELWYIWENLFQVFIDSRNMTFGILFQIIIIFFDQSIPTYLNDPFYIIVNILCLVWATTGSPKCYSTLASNWGEPWNKNRFSLTAASDLKRGKHLQPFEKVLSQDWSFDFFSSLYNRLKSPVLTGFTHLIQMSLIAAYFSCKGHLSAVRGI